MLVAPAIAPASCSCRGPALPGSNPLEGTAAPPSVLEPNWPLHSLPWSLQSEHFVLSAPPR